MVSHDSCNHTSSHDIFRVFSVSIVVGVIDLHCSMCTSAFAFDVKVLFPSRVLSMLAMWSSYERT